MTRRLLNLLTALSLLLCAAMVTVWVRGYYVEEAFAATFGQKWEHPTRGPVTDRVQARHFRGRLTVRFFPYSHRLGPLEHRRVYSARRAGDVTEWESRAYAESDELMEFKARRTGRPVLHAPGFTYRHMGIRWWTLSVCPAWPAALAAMLPAARLAGAARRAVRGRSRPGLCARCGYDLRATPERCPECGERVPA